MYTLKYCFTHQKMGWLKVILFAIIAAIITVACNEIPFLKGTSFQNIAIGYECWILFALFIIVNCTRWWEAALKTFLFFLISQPLIFLIEVPFESMGWGVFMYYPRWFYITLLTLPGAIIAYQIRREDWISVLVLSIAAGGLGYIASAYFWGMVHNFPRNLISVLFCILLAAFLSFALMPKHRKLIPFVICIIVFVVLIVIGKPNDKATMDLPAGQWEYTLSDDSIAEIQVDESGHVSITGKQDGTTIVTFRNAGGEIIEYAITYSPGGILLQEID